MLQHKILTGSVIMVGYRVILLEFFQQTALRSKNTLPICILSICPRSRRLVSHCWCRSVGRSTIRLSKRHAGAFMLVRFGIVLLIRRKDFIKGLADSLADRG